MVLGFIPHPNNTFATRYGPPSLEKKLLSSSLTLPSITNLSLSIVCTPICVSMSQSPPPPPFATITVVISSIHRIRLHRRHRRFIHRICRRRVCCRRRNHRRCLVRRDCRKSPPPSSLPQKIVAATASIAFAVADAFIATVVPLPPSSPQLHY